MIIAGKEYRLVNSVLLMFYFLLGINRLVEEGVFKAGYPLHVVGLTSD